LQGLWLRAHYAAVAINQSDVRTAVDDMRFILNYSLRIY